jgi:hypothetical protein
MSGEYLYGQAMSAPLKMIIIPRAAGKRAIGTFEEKN